MSDDCEYVLTEQYSAFSVEMAVVSERLPSL